ncbi:MAG: MSCRAMM family protein [Eubacteriales bacterium]
MKSKFFKKSMTILLVLLIVLGSGFTSLAATSPDIIEDTESAEVQGLECGPSPQGSITVTKSIGSIAGPKQGDVEFRLYKWQDAQWEFQENGFTDNNGWDKGSLTFDHLDIGRDGTQYKVEEVVPPGYTNKSNGEFEVTLSFINRVIIKSVVNEEDGRIIVNKTFEDGASEEDNPVRFKLEKKKSKKIWEEVSTLDVVEGQAIFTGLAFGTYRLTEIGPDNYETYFDDDNIIELNKDHYEKVVGVTNKPLPGDLIITKTVVGDGNGEEEDVFTLTLFNGEEEMDFSGTVVDGGVLTFEDVPAGSYTLKETDMPDGYKSSFTEGQTVVINPNGTTEVEVTNTRIGHLEVTKVINGGGASKSGVTFELYQGDGTDPVASGSTGSDGKYTFENLTVGSYTIKETNVPTGYESSLGVNGKEVAVIFNETTQTIVENTFITGDIRVIKTINTENGDPQKNVTFKLYNGEALVNTGQTDAQGIVIFEDLAPGNYQLVEEVPEGYESSIDESLTVTVVGKQTTDVNVVNAEIDDPDDEEVIIEDEETPVAPGKFPQTGGTPAFLFYGAGIGLTTLGTMIRKKIK